MIRHDIKVFCVNLCIFLFMISSLPIPSSISAHAGIMDSRGTPVGEKFISTGGNIAGQIAALIILGLPTGDPGSHSSISPDGKDSENSSSFTVKRFIVEGNSENELLENIRNSNEINDPSTDTEGSNYAAYTIADYTVDYQPYITACYTSESGVEVELSTVPRVCETVECSIPDYRTDRPDLALFCEREEKRLLDHEKGHYEAYRLVGEALADSLGEVRATGSGPNLWMAMIQARLELEGLVMKNLYSAVQLANDLNHAIDILTNHGRGIGPAVSGG